MGSHLSHQQHPQNTTGANYNTGAGDNFTYPKNTNPGLPHYITFIAKKSYTSTTSTRGQQNGSVVLYMPPDALKTQYSQTIGDIDASLNNSSCEKLTSSTTPTTNPGGILTSKSAVTTKSFFLIS